MSMWAEGTGRQMPFRLNLYERGEDGIVALGVPSPHVPPAGQVLLLHQLASGGDASRVCWEVTAVMVHYPDPASPAALKGEPLTADLIVRPHGGIHE